MKTTLLNTLKFSISICKVFKHNFFCDFLIYNYHNLTKFFVKTKINTYFIGKFSTETFDFKVQYFLPSIINIFYLIIVFNSKRCIYDYANTERINRIVTTKK